jgi:hypothetical protein
VHEIVWQVPHVSHTTHYIVALHEMLVHTRSILTNSILLPRDLAKFVIDLVDVIEKSIFILQKVGHQILLGVFILIVSHEQGFV